MALFKELADIRFTHVKNRLVSAKVRNLHDKDELRIRISVAGLHLAITPKSVAEIEDFE